MRHGPAASQFPYAGAAVRDDGALVRPSTVQRLEQPDPL